jgi:hypothetical protein
LHLSELSQLSTLKLTLMVIPAETTEETWAEGVVNSDGDADVMNAYVFRKPENKDGPKERNLSMGI